MLVAGKMIEKFYHRVREERGRAIVFCWALAVALWYSAGVVSAEQFGFFTYAIIEGEIEITDYPNAEVGDIEIPAEIEGKPVTSIGSGAFARCSGLTSVNIPESVTSVGDYSFSECIGLTSVTLSPNVTSFGFAVYSGCSGLTSVIIPEGINRVSGAMFFACSSLTNVTIPSSVDTIGARAFRFCSSLTSIDVAAGNPNFASDDGVLLNTGMTILIACPGGKTGAYTIPPSVTCIEREAFGACSELTTVIIPEGILNISVGTFSGCSGLTSINIPESVVSLDHSAFERCSGLTNINIPTGVTSIGDYSFFRCSGLTSVIVPDGVAIVGDSAFSECIGLTSVIIQDGVTRIGESAFRNCSRLSTISIPVSITSIGKSAFTLCSGLTSILVESGNSEYVSVDGILFNAQRTELIRCPEGRNGVYTLPSGVTSIGDYAFANCSALYRVVIPPGVINIGNAAFFECNGLTSLTLPRSISTMGYRAFDGCSRLSIVLFLGDAPSGICDGFPLCNDAFGFPAPNFTTFHLSGSSGFNQYWIGYPAVTLDVVPSPSDLWLWIHDIPFGTDLNQDLNGDGVRLLTAYALNLDPSQNLISRLPAVVGGSDSMSISFYAASVGISYTIETSLDLREWTPEGAILSDIDPVGQRTAMVSLSGMRRFMRLVVSKE